MGKNRRGRVDSSSSSCSVSSIEDYTSEEDYEDSRREKRNKTKRIPARAKQSYSNDSNSELDLPQTKDKHTNENVLPSVGCYRRKKMYVECLWCIKIISKNFATDKIFARRR